MPIVNCIVLGKLGNLLKFCQNKSFFCFSFASVVMCVEILQVGGVEEYEVCQALQDGRITKPLVAWCIGTCARMFTSEVQFGHAGACANSDRETAITKNKALSVAGAYVPDTFDNLGKSILYVSNVLNINTTHYIT